jgi:hypothetical protein
MSPETPNMNHVPRVVPEWVQRVAGLEDDGYADPNELLAYVRNRMPEKFDPAFYNKGRMPVAEEEDLWCDLAFGAWKMVQIAMDFGDKGPDDITNEDMDHAADLFGPGCIIVASLVKLANLRERDEDAHRQEALDAAGAAD